MNLRHEATRALAAALFLIAGCCGIPSQQQEDEQVFREIATQLNPGGTSYEILNPRNVLEGIEQTATQLYLVYTSQPEPPENAAEVSRVALHTALAWRLSGIEDIRGYGSSSVRISGKDEPARFHNRAFLMIRPESKGVLWAIPGKENRPFAPTWEALPAETDGVFQCDLNPGEALRILSGSQTIAPYLKDEKLTAILGESPEKLLDGFAGTVTFATIPAPASDKEAIQRNHIMASVPDNGGKLAGLIRKGASFLPGVKSETERIVLPPVFGEQAPQARPVILLGEGRIVFFSSLAAEKAFSAPQKKLAENADFKRFAAGLPTDGIAFVYSHGNFAEPFNQIMEQFGQTFRMPETAWPQTILSVIRREHDGFLMLENSTLDNNQKAVFQATVIPAVIGAVIIKEYQQRQAGEESTEEAPDTTAECQLKLEQFKSALAGYAAKHDGAYPAKDGLEGIRELLAGKFLPLDATVCPGAAGEDVPAASAQAFDYSNCSYLYFGGFTEKSNPKLPLVADWPLNHSGAVNVLLIDGTIEKLDLKTNNCKRIIGQLQSMYHYSEEEFRNLIRQTDAIDKLFELE